MNGQIAAHRQNVPLVSKINPVTMQPAYLPNPFYAALTTANAPFAVAHGLARRFQLNTIPFAAVIQPTIEAYEDLVPLLTLDEEIYVTADAGEAFQLAKGLTVVSTLPGLQMRLCTAPLQNGNDPQVVSLTSEDTEEMLQLKSRAFPGFFGPRAPELGSFFGVRDPESGCLIAMGGERLATYSDREVSAICTAPEHVGQGHAARIVRTVVHHQAQLGSRSFLHVTATNKRAIDLYERVGFRITGSIDFLKLKRV